MFKIHQKSRILESRRRRRKNSLFFAQTKGKSSVFSVLIRFCGEGGMSSEGGPSEHVAEPLLDEEMLSATDSETEREKQKVNLAVIFSIKCCFSDRNVGACVLRH